VTHTAVHLSRNHPQTRTIGAPLLHRPPPPPLCPYTTLFRSDVVRMDVVEVERDDSGAAVGRRSVRRQAGHLGEPVERVRDELVRSEEHTSELQSPYDLVCSLLLERKNRPHTQAGMAAEHGSD